MARKLTDLTWSDYFWHWLRFWCGMKLRRQGDNAMVQMNCRVCTKKYVTPEAWERINNVFKEEQERQEALRILDQMKVNNDVGASVARTVSGGDGPGTT